MIKIVDNRKTNSKICSELPFLVYTKDTPDHYWIVCYDNEIGFFQVNLDTGKTSDHYNSLKDMFENDQFQNDVILDNVTITIG